MQNWMSLLPLFSQGGFGQGGQSSPFVTVFNPHSSGSFPSQPNTGTIYAPSEPSQIPAGGGLLGMGQDSQFSGILGDPMFNMGIAMMGSNNPSFGGALAEGVRGAQGAQALNEQRRENEINRRFKEAQIQRMMSPPQNDPEVVRVARFMYPDNPEKQREYILSRAPQSQGPASVQEWQYFNSLSDEDKARYLTMKRAMPTYLREIGGEPSLVSADPVRGGASVTPLSTREEEDRAAEERALAKAKGGETGKAQAQAAEHFPVLEQNTRQALSVIDALLEHPGFDGIYGLKSYLPIVRGSDRAGASSFRDQIGGIAFLQAFESLKGGGQITEIEGQKATQAITRLTDPSISPEEARKAAQELREIMLAGLQRARQGLNAPASPAPAPSSSGWSIEEVR